MVCYLDAEVPVMWFTDFTVFCQMLEQCRPKGQTDELSWCKGSYMLIHHNDRIIFGLNLCCPTRMALHFIQSWTSRGSTFGRGMSADTVLPGLLWSANQPSSSTSRCIYPIGMPMPPQSASSHHTHNLLFTLSAKCHDVLTRNIVFKQVSLHTTHT